MDTYEKNTPGIPELYCAEDVTDHIIDLASELLEISSDDIEPDTKFSSMGFDSMMMIRFSQRIFSQLGVQVRPHELFRYYNAELLGKHIFEKIS
ncbi:MAG TPA: hypothetical protein DCZ62_06235 [Ruminococcus sp.]|nr:hypothetical protein [Ruminococcus sp.]